MGHRWRRTEAGLETDVHFEGVNLRLMCVPNLFALENEVWELGQMAEKRKNNKDLFDKAYRLFHDRCADDNPSSMSDALLLLNHATRPRSTNLLCQDWRQMSALGQQLRHL